MNLNCPKLNTKAILPSDNYSNLVYTLYNFILLHNTNSLNTKWPYSLNPCLHLYAKSTKTYLFTDLAFTLYMKNHLKILLLV
mmetsp:Transcript_28380/g.5156  ORF Transcript_28380/g.5156 Transcript_28380/m.5156 type:complete len:82 (-) Transcript_28380:1443-1688(-)